MAMWKRIAIFFWEFTMEKRLNLYMVDMKYVRNLHRADNRVSSVSPQLGKENRVYVGVLTILNKHKYIIPLSHPQEKHKNMKPAADFDKIYDKKGRLIAVLNFNQMIPVEDAQLIPVDLKIYQNDTEKMKAYKVLCINEIEYCRRKDISKRIFDKANTLYDLCTSKEPNFKGKSRCVDFKKLEQVCAKYNT